MELPTTFDLGHVALAVVCAIALGLHFVARKEIVNELAIQFRTFAGKCATWESDLGLSSTMVAPLSALAVGDLARAEGALIAKMQYLENEQNRANEIANVFTKQYTTNPKAKAAIDQAYADLKAGASVSQIASDVSQIDSALPPPPALPQAVSSLRAGIAEAEKVLGVIANNPALAPVMHTLQNAGLGGMAGVVSGAIDAHAALSAPPSSTNTSTGGDAGKASS
jgi:hypothetical protein